MNIDALIDSLPIVGWGMLGIFIVIGVIMLSVVILTKIFPPKKDEE